MTDKGTAKSRFISEFLGSVEDWDMHLFEALDEGENSYFKLILEEQEEFGDITNDGLGRELWFSNDFFINHLILYFMEHAQDEPDLYKELQEVYVGLLNRPQANAVALNLDEEFNGYLIIIHYEMQINIELISELVAYYVYAMQIADEGERFRFYPDMAKRLLHLINKKALFEEAAKVEQEGQKDLTWAGSIIASELFVAGMKFAIGHEIGHHFLKHTTSEGRDIVSKFIPKNKTFSVMHLDEFAADNFGFDLLVRGMKERNDNVFLAPLIVLLMLAIFDKSPEQPSKDHPSLRDRYLYLLSKISDVDENAATGLQKIFNLIANWINFSLSSHGYWKTKWWEE